MGRDPRAVTLEAAQSRGWPLVLLNGKKPKTVKGTWAIVEANDPIAQQGNLGLQCGRESGVAVLDWDDLDALIEAEAFLGELTHWVRTGSGKFHTTQRALALPNGAQPCLMATRWMPPERSVFQFVFSPAIFSIV